MRPTWPTGSGALGDPAGQVRAALHQRWFGDAEWPWVNKRMIYARDWMTYYREDDGVGGIHSLNAQLGGTDFTAEEIANVEHFYVAAMIGSMGGPAGALRSMFAQSDGNW